MNEQGGKKKRIKKLIKEKEQEIKKLKLLQRKLFTQPFFHLGSPPQDLGIE